MSPKVNRLILVAALAIGGLLSGCSGGEERAESPRLGQCETLLGAESVEAAVKTTGGGDVEVSGTPQADVLAERLLREAKQWQESDLQHTRYTGCRLDAFEGDRISGTVDVSVKWSALSMGMMDSPENSRTWRPANDSVYVQPEPGPARMRLIARCAVPGAIASQPSDLPLQFDVAGASLGAELRWELLSTFARSVTEGMGCAKSPVIPSALPPAT
ncbi:MULTISPECIES: hypothetical protein [Streptomyces]|uniref:hypothetical protein n=1 Tax=Streptomyces TaxID=1883 RepID=UPI000241AE2B|nr:MULTISPECIES: hypothetical protein [Streptomyces]EHM28887.1 hypothetical protein SPW_2675 [Streptomyces sp. W007]WSU73893.1 hypothetical protein OG499_13425 [Streptomyces anulatus]WTD27751.1 hypothetical protein OH737_26000 [Streptomyces anulatus]